MCRSKIGCLRVLDGETVVGIITESDILRAVADTTREIAMPEALLSHGDQ